MPWYLYLALRQIFPRGRIVSPFFPISVLGVALGVMILIIVQSVMGGFGQTYRELIVKTNGHLRVDPGRVEFGYLPVLSALESHQDVLAAAPFAQGIVMLQSAHDRAYPVIRGVVPEMEREVIPLESFMQDGSLSDLHDGSILLSSVLARQLRVGVGATVEVYTPLMLEMMEEEEILLPRELQVAGIYETGWHQFDSSTMVGTLRLVQELFGIEGGIQAISVRLRDGSDPVAVANQLKFQFEPPYYVSTWMEMYQDFMWVLQLEKNMMLFLLLFIIIVAAFAIMMSMLLNVMRKTRELGLIGAMGGGARWLALSYCFQGFFIGICGTALGIVMALLALHFRDQIVGAFARITGSQDMLIQFYQFAYLPVHYSQSDFIVISMAALLLSTAAGFLPAFWIARLKPAEALRYE